MNTQNIVQSFNKENKRNGRIDFLRFLFAFIVMLHHSRYLLGDDDCLFLGGSLGVEFFFIISGYFMIVSIERRLVASEGSSSELALAKDTSAFLKRKVKSLLPQLPIAWIIGLGFVVYVRRLNVRGGLDKIIDTIGEWTLLKMTGMHTGSLDGVIWYLSSMLLCMAILYPLIMTWPNMMKKIWCPLIAFMLLGITCIIDSNPRNPTKVYAFIYKGNLRAMAEICIGISIYPFVKKMSNINWNVFAKILFEFIEVIGYILLIRYMYIEKPNEKDYFYILIFAVCIILSLSKAGILSKLFDNKFSYRLGKFSLALYFSHIYYAQNLNVIIDGLKKSDKIIIYVACALATSIVVEILSVLYKKYADEIKKLLKKSMIANKIA